MANNEVIQDQVSIQLDLVLKDVDDRKFKAGLIDAANNISALISKAEVNPNLQVDLNIDDEKLTVDLKKAAGIIKNRLDAFQGSFKDADTDKFKQAFSKIFGQLGTVLTSATKEYGVDVTQAYDKLAAKNKRELDRLAQRDFESARRYAAQKRLQVDLLKQVMRESASINNFMQDGKERLPLPPVLLDNLEKTIKEEERRLQSFETFTRGRQDLAARDRALKDRKYRRTTIAQKLGELDAAQKDFNFGSVERALRKEIKDLVTLQEQVDIARKDAVGTAIGNRELQLRRVQEKRRAVFGSTLGTSIEQVEYRSATAESRYKTARDRAKRTDLPITERIAAETVAQRELNTARSQAYRVLEKLAPLEKSNAEDDQKAFDAANERVAALAKEVGVLKDLKDARIRASQQSDASTSLTTQLGKVDPLLQELSGLRRGSEDYRIVEARLRRALTKAGRAANKLDDDARFAELDQKKARVAGVLGDAGLWQAQAGRNQLQDATRVAIQSARQKQSRAQVYTDGGRIRAHNESVLAGLKRIKDDGDYTGPEKDIGAVVLSGIARQRDGEKGRSSEVLKAITEWADRNNERIVLNAKATGDLKQEELVKWYERNGFVTRRDGAMERTPRPLSATDLKRIKVEELGSEVGRDLRIITKGTAKPAALDKAARILRLNMGKLRTEAARQGGEILREFMDLETEVKQALDTLSTKDTRKELAARLREYRAARGVMWATEPGSPEYGKARLQTLKASQAASNTSQSTGVGTGIAERLSMRLRGGELLNRFSALQTGTLPTNEKDLIRFLNKVKDIRQEVERLDKEAAGVGFEEASVSAKRLRDDLDDLRKDARKAPKAALAMSPEALRARMDAGNEFDAALWRKKVEGWRKTFEDQNAKLQPVVGQRKPLDAATAWLTRQGTVKSARESASVFEVVEGWRKTFEAQNAKLQPAVGQRKPLDALTAWITGRDKVSADLQPARLYKFKEAKPPTDAELEGLVRKARTEAYARRLVTPGAGTTLEEQRSRLQDMQTMSSFYTQQAAAAEREARARAKARAPISAANLERNVREVGLDEFAMRLVTPGAGKTLEEQKQRLRVSKAMSTFYARQSADAERQAKKDAPTSFGNLYDLRSQFRGLDYRKGAISPNLLNLLGTEGIDNAVARLQILQRELRSVAGAAKESGIKSLEQEFGGLANAVGKAIRQVNQFDQAASKPVKGLTEAQIRQEEQRRIKQALIAEGQLAFEEVGGYKNYARIPKEQYKPALEAARDREANILNRFATVRDDKTLDPGIKKKQLRELTVEFNQASRAAKVLQQEINGNVGFLRQLSLAARNFARYFLFYGGMYQIIGYFTQMTRTLVDFQDSLKQTQVIAQATNDEMVSIGSTIRDVSRETGESLRVVSDAAQTLAQAGVDVKNIPAALNAVSNFALATGSNLQVAADVIASAKEIFDKDLTFGGASDQLTRAINISKLKAEDLKTIFNLGAQTAQTSGLSSAQFLGASATLSNLGIKSSTVATGLRQLLLEIFNPDEKTLQFLRKRYNQIGENYTDQEIRSRFSAFEKGNNPLVDALTELRRLGAAGSAQEDFRRVLDIRAENVGLPLIRRLDDLVRNIARISETGAAQQGADDRVDTLLKSFETLGRNAELLGEDLLNLVKGPIKEVADYLNRTIDRLREYGNQLGREGRSPVAGAGDALTGGLGGFAAGKLLGFGKFGTTLTTIFGALADLTQAKVLEGTDKGVVGRIITTLTGIFGILTLFGKKKVVGVPPNGKEAISTALSFTATVSSLFEWLKGSLSGSLIDKLKGAVSKLLPIAAASPIGRLTALAYTAYEIFDWISSATKKGPPNIDVRRQDVADLERQRGETQDEQKGYEDLKKQYADAQARAEKAGEIITDLFGAKAEQAVQMLSELGSTPLESSTEQAKKFKAQLEQKLLGGKQLSARQFSKLIEAQSGLLQAQALIATSQEKYTRDSVKLLKDTGGKLTDTQEKTVSAIEEMNREPIFGPNGFKPQVLVSRLKQLFDNADFFIKQAAGRLDAINKPLEAAKTDITTAEVKDAPERQVDLEVSGILNNPTKEGVDRLRQLREAYRRNFIDPLENDPARRAEPGKPFKVEKAKAIEDQIAEKEKRLKAFDDQIKQAEAGVAEKDKRAEEDKKAQEEQVKADEQRKADAAKKAAEITEREAKLLDMRLRSKNLEDQWETEYAAARKAQNWDALLKEKGLIDQTTEAKAQVARAEQEIAELALRKVADEKGVLDLPKDLSKVTVEQKKLLLGDPEARSAYESYLDKTQAVTDVLEEGRKRRRTVFEESKQIVPFSESDAYRDRDNKIRDLNTQIRRVQTQGSEEHLALEKEKYDLQKAQLEEQIAHLKTQEGNYKQNEKGQAQYRGAMDDLQNKLKDLQDDYDEKVIRAGKEARIKDASARVKRAREELEYLRKQQDLVGQGPTSTRMQTIQIRGQAPATTPSYPGAPGYTTPYDNLFSKFETQYKLPAGLLKAIANVETGGQFNPDAVNKSSGAQGLMQIMPAMQRRLKVADPFDPEQSIRGGAENLKWLLGYYKGDTDKAIMAYNTSFRNVDKGVIPRETRNYLPKVKAAWQQGVAPSALPTRLRSWDEFPYIDQDGIGGSDVIGLEKFKNTAPEVYQAIIGGAMKWVEEQGGKSKVMIRDLGRHGGKGNHKFGFAGDVQLVDKNGKVLPNIMAGGETFRNYERFWQDGVAYAMGQNPEWANLPDYFRYGGYFLDNTPVDIMHGDITKKYKPGTPMPAGGTLAGGANRRLLSKFSNLGIVSQGIPGGDWNAYRQARFGAGVPQAQPRGFTFEAPLLSGMLPPQSDLDRIQDLSYRQERAIDELRQALLDENRARGGGKEGERAVYEELKNEISRTDRAQQETTVDNLRSKLQQQQVALEQMQARGLRSGPADTAAREAAGLEASPQDAYEFLLDLEQVLLDLRAQAQQNLLDAQEALKTDEGIAALLEQELKDPNLSEQDRSIKQARLDEKLNNIKAYKAALIEFDRNINESTRGLATNRQQQQDVKPTFTDKVYEDGSSTYGQLSQAFDAKAIAGELNNLAYSLKNLGKNIRGFIVGAVDTFVSTVADKLVRGAEKVDTAALNQARADLYQAQGDASYNLAQQRKDLADAEAAANQMPGNAGAQARRADMQAAYAESSRSYSEAVNARQQQVRELEQQQQGQGIGGALQEAFTALSQEFASTMLKTILLSPFQAIFDKLGFGQRGSSAANPLYTKDVDAANKALPGAADKGGGVLGSEKGGIIDSVLGPLKGIFDGVGSIIMGLVSSVAQLFGNKSMGPGIGSVISGIIGGIAGFAEGGRVSGPGTGTSDSIPAWLSNGEYVLTKKEVDAIGVQNIEKWKAAMASPAKFATGGLVQTFDSAARNAANYSNAGATGGSTDVTIIDQRSQANSEPVSVSRTRGPDNKEVIQVMVRDAVKNAINSGLMDRTMAANYGARRAGVSR